MKYKVGDRVLIKKGLKGGNLYGATFFTGKMERFCGAVTTIKRIIYDSFYRIEEDDGEWCWTDEMIERKADMTRDDLKKGMVVEFRYGHIETVKNNHIVPVFFDYHYDDDLLRTDGEKQYDVVAVYEKKEIWRRYEPKKMTVKEICKELGYDVEIIKEKEE